MGSGPVPGPVLHQGRGMCHSSGTRRSGSEVLASSGVGVRHRDPAKLATRRRPILQFGLLAVRRFGSPTAASVSRSSGAHSPAPAPPPSQLPRAESFSDPECGRPGFVSLGTVHLLILKSSPGFFGTTSPHVFMHGGDGCHASRTACPASDDMARCPALPVNRENVAVWLPGHENPPPPNPITP